MRRSLWGKRMCLFWVINRKDRRGRRWEIPFLFTGGCDRCKRQDYRDLSTAMCMCFGGGGEGGFANRTPEATVEGMTRFGVTTVVGCLGTDGIGRDMCVLVAKTKGLNEQGMSAYCYTGSYQIPVRTLTDSVTKDIMMIQEIIGTGEIAISDHRSSQPTYEEFVRVVADTRLGGSFRERRELLMSIWETVQDVWI